MITFKLLGAAGLAASMLAVPAFAQGGAQSGNTQGASAQASDAQGGNSTASSGLNNPSSYSNGRSFGHQVNASAGNNAGFTSNTSNVVGNGKYANVGNGGYTATESYIRNGNNGGNNVAGNNVAGNNGGGIFGGNNNANNNRNNNNWRPSQRNPVLADNGSARASKVIGTDVYNANNQQLGSVDDILIGKNDKLFAVISTNNKKVAVPFDHLKFGNATNEGNDKIVLPDQTQARLNTMPVFHYDVTQYQGSNANANRNNGNNRVGVAGNNTGWHGNGSGPFSGTNNSAANNANNGNKGG